MLIEIRRVFFLFCFFWTSHTDIPSYLSVIFINFSPDEFQVDLVITGSSLLSVCDRLGLKVFPEEGNISTGNIG